MVFSTRDLPRLQHLHELIQLGLTLATIEARAISLGGLCTRQVRSGRIGVERDRALAEGHLSLLTDRLNALRLATTHELHDGATRGVILAPQSAEDRAQKPDPREAPPHAGRVNTSLCPSLSVG